MGVFVEDSQPTPPSINIRIDGDDAELLFIYLGFRSLAEFMGLGFSRNQAERLCNIYHIISDNIAVPDLDSSSIYRLKHNIGER